MKETPSEAEVVSHQLLLRAGMIRQLAAGIYDFLPMGLRVVRKVEAIVREEMNRQGAQEVLLPAVHPAELWIETGRWKSAGPELLRFKDRNERDYCFGPTHEEVITDLVRREIRSYRELPKTFYQIQVKFRDEVRPRFGLMRGREFIMKDAYSFDLDEACLDQSYARMYEAYARIFERCGLRFRVVDADTGNIGGKASQEFMVTAKSGEDELIVCSSCVYGANVEKAVRAPVPVSKSVAPDAMTEVQTPQKSSIEDVSAFLSVDPSRTLKVLFYAYEAGVCGVVIAGDREVNEVKLARALAADTLRLATPEEIASSAGVPIGFAGPMGLRVGPGKLSRLIFDEAVSEGVAYVAGANKKDVHVQNAVPGRDFSVADRVDVAKVRAGDPCVRCGSALSVERGIEVGHIFKLGTKYSEAMKAEYTDESGKLRTMVMGCYGIGVTRIVAAAIEQNHDEQGIVFPPPIAPFDAVVVLADWKDAELAKKAEEIYDALRDRGIDVLFDDRQESPGVKFKDSELLGIPARIVVGKRSLAQGKVEARLRWVKDATLIDPSAAADWVRAELSSKWVPRI